MGEIILSDRVLNMAESATLAMTNKSRELKAQGIDVISLSIGEPDFNTPESAKQAGIDAINNNDTHYPPVPGTPALRKARRRKLFIAHAHIPQYLFYHIFRISIRIRYPCPSFHFLS